MRPADDIRRFIDRAAVDTNPHADKTVLDAVLKAQEKAANQTSATARPRVRNIIMTNSYVKLALAAVVVLGVILGVSEFLGTGGTSGVAWAEVLEKTEQTSAVVFDMTMEVNEPDGKLVRRSKTYMSRDYGERSDTFMDGKLTQVFYRLPRKNVNYRIFVERKQYWRRDVSYDQAALDDDPRTWLKRVLSGDYVKLDRTTIDGVVVEGIEGRMLEPGGETVMWFWVDVETNLPVRIEMTGIEGGQRMKLVMENFAWDAPLDESLFEPNIPADYTLQEDPKASQTKAVAPQALTEQERAALPQIKETVTSFLQACSKRNWDEMLKYAPGLDRFPPADRAALDTHLSGFEIVQVGEPFKVDASGDWRVPCQIKWNSGAIRSKEIRVRYDKTLDRFVVFGGL